MAVLISKDIWRLRGVHKDMRAYERMALAVGMGAEGYRPRGFMGDGTRPYNNEWSVCGDCGDSYRLDDGHICELEGRVAFANRMMFHDMEYPIGIVRPKGTRCNLCDEKSFADCKIRGCKYERERLNSESTQRPQGP